MYSNGNIHIILSVAVYDIQFFSPLVFFRTDPRAAVAASTRGPPLGFCYTLHFSTWLIYGYLHLTSCMFKVFAIFILIKNILF